jgi:hypothetical protein
VSGIGRDQFQNFHTDICGYQDLDRIRNTKLGVRKQEKTRGLSHRSMPFDQPNWGREELLSGGVCVFIN